jgi:Multimeric flavodoxin WrbA
MLAALGRHCVTSGPVVRVAGSDVLAGVSSDEGDGDGWPDIRREILAADLFVLGTPVWMGHPSSYAQRVLERLDAFLGETASDGRPIALDRVALVALVGNEGRCYPG